MIDPTTIFYALVGGILPALVWLAFWLREDNRHPEPRNLIVKTFVLGMLSVVLVLPFQQGVTYLFPALSVASFIVWAILEELFKFGAAYFGGLRSKEDNEPIDPLIYMITASLGFVALENALFILGPLVDKEIALGFLTGNLRFIGANLLHIVSSGLVGAALAISFYKTARLRAEFVVLALAIASGFHAIFNILLVSQTNFGPMAAIVMVWVSVGVLLLFFEKAKSIAP